MDSTAGAPGSLRSVRRIGYYPAVVSRLLLRRAGLSESLPIEHGVVVYRVEYWTTGPDAEGVHASGLVAIPRSKDFRGVVSYQHPTRTDRGSVPSTPSKTALFVAIAFAGHGYILVAPDYLGLGSSPGRHPYLHSASEASAVVDLLGAAVELVRQKDRTWPELLFLTGFSQGGHASLAAHRALEAAPVEGLRVTATAPIAGTYNLSGIQFPKALEGASENHPAYLGYLATGYAHVYDEPITTVIRERYAQQFDTLYGGSMSMPDIVSALPSDPKELLRPEFLTAVSAGQETWFTRAMTENDVFSWTPHAPIRFYYGRGDQDSPMEDTRFTVEHMQSRGGRVSLVDVGDVDHNGVAFAAVPLVRAWFDSVAASSQ